MEHALDRRAVLGLGAAAMAGLAKGAQAEPASDSAISATEVIALWPWAPPGGHGVQLALKAEEVSPEPSRFHHRLFTGVATPTLTVFRPERPDGSAVLVIPGGAYTVEAFDHEGVDVARALNAFGVTAFVLMYRLPAEGWSNPADVPLQDAQRAMRVIRAHAPGFGLDPARVGVIGFSAGGHMAASLATRADAPVYDRVDAADSENARPAFAALMYPVITMLAGTHAGSRLKLLGADSSDERLAAYSCERLVTRTTPPTFLCLAADDDIVPYVPNGIAMFDALRKADIAAELHVFQQGGHGFSIRGAKGKPTGLWPQLLAYWANRNGWFRSPAAQPA